MVYVLLMIAALGSGIVQGVTGFGAGVLMMLVLANLFDLPQAAGLSGMIGLTLVSAMAFRYRSAINFRIIIWPCLSFLLGSTIAISLSKGLNQGLLKMAFSLFLIGLSAYFLWQKKELELKASLPVMLGVGLFSGLCDGFFSIGGPLMVILYLAMTSSVEEYLGSLQLSFALSGLYSFSLRFFSGIITAQLLPFALVGIVAIQLGLQIGNRIVDRIDAGLLRRLTYAFIGISGAITLVTTLLTL
ncbi:sulfite exporter TauE/SafE family protein [Streptococcus suis]|nr:sulfite exporter TauE/SafE family protein [Streptococcus suis]